MSLRYHRWCLEYFDELDGVCEPQGTKKDIQPEDEKGRGREEGKAAIRNLPP